MPMRLDSDVKGNISKTSNAICALEGVCNSMRVRSRDTSVSPMDSVHLTIATSSGDEA